MQLTHVQGGDLFEVFIKTYPFTESKARAIMFQACEYITSRGMTHCAQMTSAVQFLHTHGIAHRLDSHIM